MELGLRIFNQPLMVDQSRLDGILATLQRGPVVTPEAFFFFFEDPEPNDFEVVNGIARIDIHRPFLRPRTYHRIRTQINQAIAAQHVRGILLDIDTPGGEVAGLFDLVDFIFEARDQKPIWALANDAAFSAGYAIASGADRISVTRTGGIGSIGIIAIHVEFSRMDERMGVTFTPVFSGDRKADYLESEPLNDTAKELLQTEVDRLRTLFVETVARNRGVSEDSISDTEAGAFFGPSGVPLLADAVENLDQVFEEFASSIDAGAASAQHHHPKEKGMAKETKTTPTEKSNTDAAAAEATAKAAATAEAERVAAEANKGADVVDIETARGEGHKVGATQEREKIAARTAGIEQACALAGCPQRFGEFLTGDLTVEAVGKQLLEEKHAAAGTEINGQHGSSGGDDVEPTISTEAVYASRRVS